MFLTSREIFLILHTMDKLPDSFRDKIVISITNFYNDSPCWEWIASLNNKGYGRFMYERTAWLSHRFAYTVLVETIQDGLELDHLCRNIICCNPSHLEAVTHQENMLRGKNMCFQIKSNKTHCPKDHLYDEENTYYYPNGRRGCRICISDSGKKRQMLKSDEIKTQKKVWRGKNKEKIQEDGKQYYQTNKEQIQVVQKAWRENNRDKNESVTGSIVKRIGKRYEHLKKLGRKRIARKNESI